MQTVMVLYISVVSLEAFTLLAMLTQQATMFVLILMSTGNLPNSL